MAVAWQEVRIIYLSLPDSFPMPITCRQDVGENVGREESVPVLITSRIQCTTGTPGRTSGNVTIGEPVLAVAWREAGIIYLFLRILSPMLITCRQDVGKNDKVGSVSLGMGNVS